MRKRSLDWYNSDVTCVAARREDGGLRKIRTVKETT